jgi:DNA mismatch endonuclease (patch repair protein)
LFPTRTEWWIAKITRTMERDAEVTHLLAEQRWTVLRFWESEVLAEPDAAAEQIATLLRGQPTFNE